MRIGGFGSPGAVSVFCRAVLNYTSRTPGGQPPVEEIEVEVRDGREAGLPGWQECGFQLVTHPSAVQDWTDDEEIAAVHYAEAEAVARSLTGCDVALVSDHVRRRAGQDRVEREQSPVRLVHSDFAPNYDEVVRGAYRGVHGRGAATLARNGVSAEEVEAASRIIMLQLWRNTGPTRMDYPLAFCDARTVTPGEGRPFRYTGYVAGGRAFDALAIVAPETPSPHAWYTFPGLTTEEVVAFRTYDTELVGRAQTYFTPHSAFRDPRVEPGRPARTSVELRVMCLFR